MRSSTAIPGLDEVLHGGLPQARTTVVIGGPGTGKTVLGLQYLIGGATHHGDAGLMISFEESPEKLAADFATMSIPAADELAKRVHLVDARPVDDSVAIGSYDIQGLIAIVGSLVKEHGIARIVVDGIDALFTSESDVKHVEQQITRFLHWLGDTKLTAIVTMKARGSESGLPDGFGFAEFAADGVILLRSAMHGELQQRLARVVKLRGASFATGDHAYTISKNGLSVLHEPERRSPFPSEVDVRHSTGIERLDRMLHGGYRRGTVALISGLPGAAKTTFGAAFLAAGCAAGERALFIGFDEPAEQMISDVCSVGIALQQYRESGLLVLESISASSAIGEEHYFHIQAAIERHRPERIVIDPISALVKAGGVAIANLVCERLSVLIKSHGCTAVFTAISDAGPSVLESTPTTISCIADTWIHLAFAPHGGERNRTLTIVKSRGTGHSGQVREVILDEDGITLADVYTAEGTVLFGAARLEREQRGRALLAEEARTVARELARLDDEQNALAARRAELAERSAAITRETAADQAEVQLRREIDPETLVAETEPVGAGS
jgi:circadian clock protein KaiC